MKRLGLQPFIDWGSPPNKNMKLGFLELPIGVLRFTQDSVRVDVVKSKILDLGSDLVSVSPYYEAFFINDGHHSLAAQILAGRTKILVESFSSSTGPWLGEDV